MTSRQAGRERPSAVQRATGEQAPQDRQEVPAAYRKVAPRLISACANRASRRERLDTRGSPSPLLLAPERGSLSQPRSSSSRPAADSRADSRNSIQPTAGAPANAGRHRPADSSLMRARLRETLRGQGCSPASIDGTGSADPGHLAPSSQTRPAPQTVMADADAADADDVLLQRALEESRREEELRQASAATAATAAAATAAAAVATAAAAAATAAAACRRPGTWPASIAWATPARWGLSARSHLRSSAKPTTWRALLASRWPSAPRAPRH